MLRRGLGFSFDLNVKSMHRTIRAFLPGILESGRGSIVNISSAAGVFKAAPNRYVYGATKAAVAALTRAVAADFITKGIRCNCICPGTIETPSMLNRAAAAGPQGREMFVSRQPMDGSAPRRKSQPSPSISPATKARSPPASRTSSMAAGRCDKEPHPGATASPLSLEERPSLAASRRMREPGCHGSRRAQGRAPHHEDQPMKGFFR